MMIIKPAFLFLAFVVAVPSMQSPLISAPFDNFRVECAKSSGAVRISVRMVGSQGFIRQDIVFAILCERVDELYPWYGIPSSVMELEREDCYYSHLFDPIVDTESQYTCRPREYISGITRLSDTRVQVLCCRLRTRDEANCEEKEFSKPIGSDPRTEIYYRKQLINSIAVEGQKYRVRFCDLSPRPLGLIYDDLPVTTTTTAETPKNREHHSWDTDSDMLISTTVRNKARTKNERRTSQATTMSSPTKRTIRPSTSNNFEDIQNVRNMSNLSSVKNNQSQNIQSSSEVQRTSGGNFSAVMDTVTDEKSQNTESMTDEINTQNFAIPTASSVPVNVTQNQFTTLQKQIVLNDRSRTGTTVPYLHASSVQTTTSSSLILLKPLNSKIPNTKTSLRNKQPISTSQRMQRTLSFDTTPQTTTSIGLVELEHLTENPSLLRDQLRRDSSSGVHFDEETKYSPFENTNNNPSPDNEALKSEFFYTSANPFDINASMENDDFLYRVSNEIRRAPIKSRFSNKQNNKMEREFNFPSFVDENIEDVGLDYVDYDFPMKKSGDGSRTYVPENQEPLNAPSDDASESAQRMKKKVQQNDQDSDTEQKDDLSKELLPMNDDEINLIPMDVFISSAIKPYPTVSSEQNDLKFPTTKFNHLEKIENENGKIENFDDPENFYHTPPPKRPTQTEKVLTFCTKEIAIRDRYNLVIACGSETEIWQPFRCPKGSECFFSADSSYRICCAVAEAARYTE